MLKRVVITGIGGICGLGNDVPAIWSAMREGRSGIGPIENPSLHDLKVKVGCEIKALPDHGIDRKQVVSMDRYSLLAVIAAREAMQQSGLVAHADNTYRMGAVVGAGFETIEENYRAILIEGRNRAAIFTVPKVMPGAAAGQVSMNLGLRGPVFGATSACASANHAIASAADQIRLGRADVMIAGGAEAPLVWG
ncbi:MAG: beta-ACP synthase, partial [Mesorhizobium sp.]